MQFQSDFVSFNFPLFVLDMILIWISWDFIFDLLTEFLVNRENMVIIQFSYLFSIYTALYKIRTRISITVIQGSFQLYHFFQSHIIFFSNRNSAISVTKFRPKLWADINLHEKIRSVPCTTVGQDRHKGRGFCFRRWWWLVKQSEFLSSDSTTTCHVVKSEPVAQSIWVASGDATKKVAFYTWNPVTHLM